MTYVHVYFTSGSSVHLRSSAENNSNNVITELPYGYTIAYDYTISPFKHVLVNDGIDVIEGFVHENYLTASNIQCSEDKKWMPRYSTTAWKRTTHYNKYYLPVKRIQQDLYNLGYTQVGTPDGYYGNNTENAVKAFQSAYGLTSDGIFGTNSKKKLWSLTPHASL